MTEAVAVTVAKAVATQIEAARDANNLSKVFTIERSYADWDKDLTGSDSLELPDESKLRVDVVSHTTLQTAEL